MRLQRDSFSCGVAVIINAILCFGKIVSEKQVRKFSNTTKELGTDEKGILNALKHLGFRGEEYYLSKNWTEDALYEALSFGWPVIICVDNLDHWCCVIGHMANKYVVFDSLNSKSNKKENGTYVLTPNQLRKRWKSKDDGSYYAIVVKKSS